MRRDQGGRDRDDKAFDEIVVKVRRCAKVVKGGKRFSFSALVVVGDRKGQVGIGHGKAKEVPFAVEKAIKDAKKNMQRVSIKDTTIPHRVHAKYGSTLVTLVPACKGTGLIAGASVRAVLELAGVHDILSKVWGSTNPGNVVQATMSGLQQIKSKRRYEELRGVAVV
ncbi:MAG: 30S ribosomal protein S5 [Planctomycetes bacterium]|nr:30S ribosomal protein S5 [Planctomycetota bacterium]